MKKSVCIVAFLFIFCGIGLAQEIKVTRPASGMSWNIGDTQPIRWTSTGTTQPSVKIMLWQGDANVMDIVNNTPNNGMYPWKIPASLAPGTYKVRVRTVGDNIVGISAAFDISNAKIVVTQPTAGVTWNTGENHLIQWTHSGPMHEYVRIDLYQFPEGREYSVELGTPNNGSYSWTVPAGLPAGTSYQIQVKTVDLNVSAWSPRFGINTGARAVIINKERPQRLLKFPALSISDVTLSPNVEGFVVTFGYKNSGTGPLPKGSEMPVKPNFRVLIDNREVNQGSLFIPEFPAPPGWEVPTYHGCFIKCPPLPNFDYSWTVGNLVTVKINENAVNGMASDSQSYNLKPMALHHSYDVLITGVTLDWAKEILTVNIRIDGKIGALKTLMVVNDKPYGQFAKYIDLADGKRSHTITHKLDGLFRWQEYKGRLWALLKADKNAYADFRDIEHRNNEYNYSFHR